MNRALKNQFTIFIAMLMPMIATSTQSNAETLRIATQNEISLLDPHALNETFSIGILGNVMEGLIGRDSNLRIVPGLATSWEQLSPVHWRFHLRKGVRFHDGSIFTADDVLFSMQRARHARSQMRVRVPEDARFLRTGSHTVDVLLKTPDPILHMGWDNLYIMSKAWAERRGLKEPVDIAEKRAPDAANRVNGTGPYRLISHRQSGATTFERNPSWWGQRRPEFSRVVLTPVLNSATRTAALMSGQADVIVPVSVDHASRLGQTPGVTVKSAPELRTIFLNLDSHREELKYSNVKGANPFKDRRVRIAIYHAIDISALRIKTMRGFMTPSALLISPALFSLSGEFERRPLDLDKARILMREAGYENGFQVTLDCPNNRYVKDEEICMAISGMLAKIGIRVDIRAVPKSRFFRRVTAASGYDSSMSLLGWTPGTMDGLEILTYLAGCRDSKGNGAMFNLGGYCNPRLDALAGRIRTETLLSRRNRLLADAYRILHDDAGIIPLHQQAIIWGVADHVEATVRADNQIRFDLIRRREIPGQAIAGIAGRR